jgi:hypothetical protein
MALKCKALSTFRLCRPIDGGKARRLTGAGGPKPARPWSCLLAVLLLLAVAPMARAQSSLPELTEAEKISSGNTRLSAWA